MARRELYHLNKFQPIYTDISVLFMLYFVSVTLPVYGTFILAVLFYIHVACIEEMNKNWCTLQNSMIEITEPPCYLVLFCRKKCVMTTRFVKCRYNASQSWLPIFSLKTHNYEFLLHTSLLIECLYTERNFNDC